MKAHSFDAVSLVFGMVFAGIGALFLTGNDVGDLVARFWPAAVVLLGLAMLFTARRADAADPLPSAAPAAWPAPPAERPDPPASQESSPPKPVQ
ncbi:MAG: hypothetical protein WD178_01715 [Actinomycetota bacterium]